MTDERFRELLKQKALARKNKIKEVRAKEREARAKTEKEYKELISILSEFRKFDFIVLKGRSNYVTIYPGDSYEIVESIINTIEQQYLNTGELNYEIYRLLKS